MPRPKKKPDYDADKIMEDFTAAIIDCFGRRYDDRVTEQPGTYPSLNSVAAEFGITVIKTRKILITAGYYSTATSRRVAELVEERLSVSEIMDATGLKYAAVQAYLPYSKKIYKLDELSTNAERTKLYRERKEICRKIAGAESVDENMLFDAVTIFQNYPFQTSAGYRFTYVMNEDSRELLVSARNGIKNISFNTIVDAMRVNMDNSGEDGKEYIRAILDRLGIAIEIECN